MKGLAVSVSVLWLLHMAQAEAACRVAAPTSTELPRIDCRRPDIPEHSEAEWQRRFQGCILARPVLESEKEQARASIGESNCFLRSVLRPEISDAIKRGAEAYLAMRRSERTSEGTDKLNRALDDAAKTLLPERSADSEDDLILLLLVLVERVHSFRGPRPGPVSGLEEEGRRRGIYINNYLVDWVLFEYASFLTGSESLRAEATKLLKAKNPSSAPPRGYAAKGCKRKILYNWPTLSTPKDSYNDLPGDPGGDIGDYDVHWGVCPDDHSLWVYHYQFGWKKASASEVIEMCRQPERRRLVGLECVDSQQPTP